MEAVGEYGGLDLDQTKPLDKVTSGYTPFREGDVLVAKITPCFENGKGAVACGLTNGAGFGTTELHVLRPGPDLDRRFLFYVSISVTFRRLGEGGMYGAGGQKRVTTAFISDFRTPLPPLAEQRASAGFLDRATARVDALVAKKRRLLGLLAEKRQALITHAVTRGLDPHAPTRPTAIDWLGNVPACWKYPKLKHVCRIQNGVTLGKRYDDGIALVERPYLRVANVQDGYLDLSEIKMLALPVSNVARHELRAGDVLMTEGGDFDKLGRGCVWHGQVEGSLHQNHIFAVRPDQRRLLPEFLAAVLVSDHGKHYFTSTSSQTTNLATTNTTKLGNLPLMLPPINEQRTIVAHLDAATARLDELSAEVTAAIGRLAEYRAALITAAVTGRVDVRAAGGED